jgi:hypothetical protein
MSNDGLSIEIIIKISLMENKLYADIVSGWVGGSEKV